MTQVSGITEIFKARNNILQQLDKQGYDTKDYIGSSTNEVNSMFNSKQLDMLLTNKKQNIKLMSSLI